MSGQAHQPARQSDENAALPQHPEEESLVEEKRSQLSSPISKLSTEVLAGILLIASTYMVSGNHRVEPDFEFMLVCRQWDAIIKTTPDFWTFLGLDAGKFRDSKHNPNVQWWRERSGGLPLQLHIYFNIEEELTSAWLSVVKPVVARLQSLKLTCFQRSWRRRARLDSDDEGALPRSGQMPEWWDDLVVSPLKHLEVFDYNLSQARKDGDRIPVPCPPNLQFLLLSLSNVPPLQSSTLSELDVHNTKVLPLQISEIMARCPNIKTLRVFAKEGHTGAAIPLSVAASHEPQFPNLEVLRFQLNRVHADESNLSHWILSRSPNIRSLSFLCEDGSFPFFNPQGQYDRLTDLSIWVPELNSRRDHDEDGADLYTRWAKWMILWLERTPNLKALSIRAPNLPNVIELLLQAFLAGPTTDATSHAGLLCPQLSELTISCWPVKYPNILKKVMEERGSSQASREDGLTPIQPDIEGPSHWGGPLRVTTNAFKDESQDPITGEISSRYIVGDTAPQLINADFQTFAMTLDELKAKKNVTWDDFDTDELTKISDRQERLARFLQLVRVVDSNTPS